MNRVFMFHFCFAFSNLANLKVSSFDLILSLEFLLKIAQFMTPPEDNTVSKIATSSSPNVEKQVVTTTNASSTKTSKRKFLF